MTEYYNFLEAMEGKTYDHLIKRFSKFIKKFPYEFDLCEKAVAELEKNP